VEQERARRTPHAGTEAALPVGTAPGTGAGAAAGEDRQPVVVTPIAVSPRVRLLLAVAVLAVLAWLLWAAPTVPGLLLTGGALALVLSFPVRLLSRWLPRKLAILLVVVGLLLLVGIGLPLLLTTVALQLADLVAAVPAYAADAQRLLDQAQDALRQRGWLGDQPDTLVDRLEAEALVRAQGTAEWLLSRVLGFATGTIGTLIQLFGTLFVAVYLLADFGRFTRAVQRAAPPSYQDDVAALWRALDESLSRYLGGLLISITLQGTAAALALTWLDVPYAVLLGLWTAATAILPYVGAFLGAIPAVIAALFVSPLTAVLVALVYLAINQIEGNLLTPRIQGEAVRVHPLLIFLAVIAGGEIGGLLGAAIAVPTLAVVRVLVDFFAERLYVRQHPPATAGEPDLAALAGPSADEHHLQPTSGTRGA